MDGHGMNHLSSVPATGRGQPMKSARHAPANEFSLRGLTDRLIRERNSTPFNRIERTFKSEKRRTDSDSEAMKRAIVKELQEGSSPELSRMMKDASPGPTADLMFVVAVGMFSRSDGAISNGAAMIAEGLVGIVSEDAVIKRLSYNLPRQMIISDDPAKSTRAARMLISMCQKVRNTYSGVVQNIVSTMESISTRSDNAAAKAAASLFLERYQPQVVDIPA